MMRSKFSFVLIASTALSACATMSNGYDDLSRGVGAVNVPVVSRADYVFDAAAPYGGLSNEDSARLDAWFRGLQLGYGDVVYVDGAGDARNDVATIAGRYGMLVTPGAPVTATAVPAGSVRVVVSRTQASVPNCPNWSRPAQPNLDNRMMSNFGCAVNGNLAAMVANPNDLVYGREGSGVVDPATAARAVQSYRQAKPTGEGGLKEVTTKGTN